MVALLRFEAVRHFSKISGAAVEKERLASAEVRTWSPVKTTSDICL